MISIKVFVGDLAELVGKKLVKVEGGNSWLLLTFENGANLDIAANDDDFPASLDLVLSYAHRNDR